MSISAIIFDCDGVLVNSEAVGVEVERRALARIGLDYDKQQFVSRFTGLADTDFQAALDADHRAQLGRGLPENFFQAMSQEKWKVFQTELKAVGGVKDLLSAITLPKAVASSEVSWKLAEKLRLTELHSLFAPHIYSSEQVERRKPAPDVFLLAARKLGIAADNCLVIEDSINGVTAAVAAGMVTWGFTGGGHAHPELREQLKEAGAAEVFNNHATIRGRFLQEPKD